MLQRRVRPAGAAPGAHRGAQPSDPGGARRDVGRVALRPFAAVRVDRGVHVRGRRAARRATRRGAVARPRAAARPARCRGAALAARRRGGRPGRARAAAAHPGARRTGRGRGARPVARARPAPPRRAARPRDARRPGPSWTPGCRRCSSTRRAIQVGVAGEQRLAAAEDAARLRDALGVAVPVGLPAAFTDPVDTPLRDLVERFARTHGPFTTAQLAARLGLGNEVVRLALADLAADGRVVEGEFRPGGREREWVDAEVLRQLRRRSLAALRKEVAPVDATALARFLPRWQGVGSTRRGADALAEVVGVLQGAAVPASLLEPDVLGLRVGDYRPSDLDLLCTSGEVVWLGAGSVGAHDGRVRLVFRDQVAALVPAPADPADTGLDRRPPRGAARATWCRGARRSGPTWSPRSLRRGCPTTTPPCSPPCGTWSGPARSPTTPSRRCGPRSPVAPTGAPRAPGPAVRRGPRRGGSPGAPRRVRPPQQGGGRRPQRSSPHRRRRPSRSPQRALQLLERYGVLTREMALAEGAEGGFAGRVPRAQAARGAGPGAPRLLRRRARRRPVRQARCGRPAPGRRRGRCRGRGRPDRPSTHAVGAGGGRRVRARRLGAGRDRSGAALRRGPGLADRPAATRPGRSVPTSCSSTATRVPTWSAAASACSRSPPAADHAAVAGDARRAGVVGSGTPTAHRDRRRRLGGVV